MSSSSYDLSTAIRAHLEASGDNYRMLADRCGITGAMVYNWCNSPSRNIRWTAAQVRVARACGFEPDVITSRPAREKKEPSRRDYARQSEMVRRYTETDDTLQNIADDYGISRERVRQIIRKAGVVGTPDKPWKKAQEACKKAVIAQRETRIQTKKWQLETVKILSDCGLNTIQMEEKTGISRIRCRFLRQEMGIRRGIKRRTLPNTPEALAMLERGESSVAVAQFLGCSSEAVRLYRHKLGYAPYNRRKYSKEAVADVIRLHASGIKPRRIASIVTTQDLTYSKVRNILKGHMYGKRKNG